MKHNVGDIDKLIRIIIGFIAGFLGWKYNPWFYIITIIAFITAAMAWCPLYMPFHISTAK